MSYFGVYTTRLVPGYYWLCLRVRIIHGKKRIFEKDYEDLCDETDVVQEFYGFCNL